MAPDIAAAATTEPPATPPVEAVIAADEDGCLAALKAITGQGCLNGAICKWKKADCADATATFTEPVCDCGGRGDDASAGVCFWGQSCEHKVDSCPGDTQSCNVVRRVKAGVDPAKLVCSSNVWPARLCSKDDPESGWKYKVSASAARDELHASAGGQEAAVAAGDDPAGKSYSGLAVGLVFTVLVLIIVAVFIASKRSATQEKGVADAFGQKAASIAKMNPTYQYEVAGSGNAGVLYAGANYSELSAADMKAAGMAPYEVAAVYEGVSEPQQGQPGYLVPVALGDALYLEPVEQPQYADAASSEYPDMYGTLAGMAGMSAYDVAGGGGGEAMYDTAAPVAAGTSSGDVMYDTAGGGGGDAMYDTAAASGATGPTAEYEYNTGGGAFEEPTYAIASSAAATEAAPEYVLANNDPMYALANGGDAFEEPMYDMAADDGYLAVLPDDSNDFV